MCDAVVVCGEEEADRPFRALAFEASSAIISFMLGGELCPPGLASLF